MYAGYGLVLDCEIPLPELGPQLPAVRANRADVVVRLGAVDAPTPAATLLPHGMWIEGERIGIDVPDVGRFLCEAGARITVDPLPGTEPDVLRLFLLGSAFGALMVQRGHLVLHGNAFRVGDACAVVVGHSGAGKSTLAAEMHRRGHDVLSDDVVPVDDAGRALPGWPRLKLWADALDRLGVPTDDLRRVRDSHAKFHVPLDRPALAPLPIRWIYTLDRHDEPLRITRLGGAEVFTSLHEHSYRKEILVGAHRRTHLARSADLAARVRFARVDRPRGVDSVHASADAILADIAATTPDTPATSRTGTGPATREEQHATTS